LVIIVLNGKYFNYSSGYESELKTVKDQLVLLHLQLKFERHRRDSHAERNRRLLGKSRKNHWLEEHNLALVCFAVATL